MRPIISTLILALTFAGFSGCAASAVTKAEYATPTNAISEAKTMGAQDHPKGEYYVTMAEDEVAAADKLIDDDENAEARTMLKRATAAADLAKVIAKTQQLEQEEKMLEDKIKEIKD